jgi:hypothetical protein
MACLPALQTLSLHTIHVSSMEHAFKPLSAASTKYSTLGAGPPVQHSSSVLLLTFILRNGIGRAMAKLWPQTACSRLYGRRRAGAVLRTSLFSSIVSVRFLYACGLSFARRWGRTFHRGVCLPRSVPPLRLPSMCSTLCQCARRRKLTMADRSAHLCMAAPRRMAGGRQIVGHCCGRQEDFCLVLSNIPCVQRASATLPSSIPNLTVKKNALPPRTSSDVLDMCADSVCWTNVKTNTSMLAR